MNIRFVILGQSVTFSSLSDCNIEGGNDKFLRILKLMIRMKQFFLSYDENLKLFDTQENENFICHLGNDFVVLISRGRTNLLVQQLSDLLHQRSI